MLKLLNGKNEVLTACEFSSVAQLCPTLCNPMDCIIYGININPVNLLFFVPQHPLTTSAQTIVVNVQLLSCVELFAAPWTAAHQTSLSITNSLSLLKLMSIELVMPSNHLIL